MLHMAPIAMQEAALWRCSCFYSLTASFQVEAPADQSDISHTGNRQDAGEQQPELPDQAAALTARTGSLGSGGSGEGGLTDRQDSLSSRRPKTPRSELRTSLEINKGDPVPSPNARSRKMRKSARDNQPD